MSTVPSSEPSSAPTPPIAKQVPTERTHHGDTVIDPYAWLHDKQNPEVIAYLNAENTWTDANLDAFLKGPADFAPGTKMFIQPLSDEDRAAVIEYLKTLKAPGP